MCHEHVLSSGMLHWGKEEALTLDAEVPFTPDTRPDSSHRGRTGA